MDLLQDYPGKTINLIEAAFDFSFCVSFHLQQETTGANRFEAVPEEGLYNLRGICVEI